MFQNLFDKVSEIIQRNGKDILKENKFWYILMDEYNFNSEPVLKSIFKDVLNSGYFNEISSSLFKKHSIKIIRSYFDNLKVKFPNNEDDIIAALFSIAIGLDKCSLSDYNSFNIQNTPKPKRKNPFNNKKKKRSNQPSQLKNWEKIQIWVAIITGIIVTVGGTWLYWDFFRGTEMASIIIMIAIIQFPYAGFVWLLYKLNRHKEFKKTLLLTVYPFSVAALINSILWFPLMIAYDVFGNYLELYGAKAQEGGSLFFAFLFGAGYFYGMFKLSIKARSQKEYCIKDSWTKYDKNFIDYNKIALISLYTILCIVSPCFRKVRNYYGDKSQVTQNQKLITQRQTETKDLSYMGISIGENYAVVLDSVKKKSPVVFYADCHVIIKGKESIWQVIDSIQSNHTDKLKDDPGPDNISLIGQHFWQFDSLYNQPIDFYIYGFNDVIQLIKLEFKDGYLSKKEFKTIEKIYEEKYGTPENYNSWNILSYGKDSKFSYVKDGKGKEDILIWTFRNGLIYMSNKEILYLSKNLYSLIKQKQEESLLLKDKIEKQRIEQLRKEQIERQEKERQQKERDSLDRIESYNKALRNI